MQFVVFAPLCLTYLVVVKMRSSVSIVLVLAVVALVGSTSVAASTENASLFKEWMNQYNKVYTTDDEFAKR
jgi:hypothetical protein